MGKEELHQLLAVHWDPVSGDHDFVTKPQFDSSEYSGFNTYITCSLPYNSNNIDNSGIASGITPKLLLWFSGSEFLRLQVWKGHFRQ